MVAPLSGPPPMRRDVPRLHGVVLVRADGRFVGSVMLGLWDGVQPSDCAWIHCVQEGERERTSGESASVDRLNSTPHLDPVAQGLLQPPRLRGQRLQTGRALLRGVLVAHAVTATLIICRCSTLFTFQRRWQR